MARKVYDEEKIRAIAEKIRECAGTKETFTTEEMPSGVDKVYNAGVEVGKSQGASKPTLYGTYVIKEEAEGGDVSAFEHFLGKGVYAYFYDPRIKEYRYLEIDYSYIGLTNEGLYWQTAPDESGMFLSTDCYFDGSYWSTYLTDINTDNAEQFPLPDAKGRIIVFTKPTEVSENFYNLFTQNIDTEIDIFGEGEESGVVEGIEEGIKQGYAEGYDAGNSQYYASVIYGTYENSVFPKNYEMILKFQKTPIRWYRAFASAKNLKSVKVISDDKEEIIVECGHMCNGNTDIEIVDLTECSRKFSSMGYAFFQAHNLKSILGELDLSECANDSTLNYAFFSNSLEEVRFVANTIKAAIRFTSIYLTEASTDSIVNGLEYLADGTTKRLEIPSNVISRLTEEQFNKIYMKNWTV